MSNEREAQLQILVDEGNIIISCRLLNYFICILFCIGKLAWSLDTATKIRKKNTNFNWSHHYAALSEYYKEHGTCNIPQSHSYECDLPGMRDDVDNIIHYKANLGKWLTEQRQARKGQGCSKLSNEREAQLQILVDDGNIYIHLLYIDS